MFRSVWRRGRGLCVTYNHIEDDVGFGCNFCLNIKILCIKLYCITHQAKKCTSLQFNTSVTDVDYT
jgi:hypothetical protein